MRKLHILVMLLISVATAGAVNIPKGTFHFDNSLTQYSNVKFIYGSDSKTETYVLPMTHDEGSRWSITIPETVTDMYRYTFADTSLDDGKIADTFSNVKEYISKTLKEKRTATTDKTILVGGIYTPESGDNWAQGSWQPLNNSPKYSGTLPVMFINTENGVAITSKEVYVNATYYIDNMGIDRYESIGSAEEQLPLEIKGRGNYTWTGFSKKPYRIKLGAKAELLGMYKSRHFTLLAHTDDNLAFLRNTVGFELSRRIGLAYTPAQRPIEVVLNGDYIGLYFLTETIRVAKSRVNITEQPDLTTDTDSITGGWIIEIDNYDDDSQVRITEGNGEVLRFTYKSPEILSSAQNSYLTAQVNAMDDAIYASDKSSTAWESLIDMDTLARYYIVQEILDDAESFHGSCYLHKDMGNDSKWIFGPVWDFGNSYRRSGQQFIYQNPPYGQSWIGEIAKFPRFQQKVIEIWKDFKGNRYDGLDNFINDFIDEISTASQYSAARWTQYGNSDAYSGKSGFNSYLTNRINWLVSQWGEGESGFCNNTADDNICITTPGDGYLSVCADAEITGIFVHDMSGRTVRSAIPHSDECIISCPGGIYIVEIRTGNAIARKKIIIR